MTRSVPTLLAALFLAVAPASAQDRLVEGPVTVEPAAPRTGQPVVITYDPHHPEAALSPDEPAVELVWRHFNPAQAQILPFGRDGAVWRVTLPPSERARFVGFQVQGDSTKGDHGGRHWGFAYHDADGRPVRGAGYARSLFYLYDRYRGDPAKDSVVVASLREALAAHPDDVASRALLAVTDTTDTEQARADALAAVQAFEAEHEGETWALREASDAYDRLDADEDVERLDARIAALNPRSGEAESLAEDAWDDESDPDRKRALQEQFLLDFPGSIRAPYAPLLTTYADSPDRLVQTAQDYVAAERVYPADAYATAALALADADVALDTALNYARTAVRRAAEGNVAGGYMFYPTDAGLAYLPIGLTPSQRRVRVASNRARLEGVLGRVLFLRGDLDDARTALETATEGAPLRRDPWIWLGELHEATDDRPPALAAYERALRLEPADSTARAGYGRAFEAVRGSRAGLDDALLAIQQETLAEDRLDQALDPFTVTDLDGAPISSVDLEGKVVVLDLWAAWCSPCVRAFPFLDRVRERYGDDPRVRVVALHTGWNETIEEARAFAAETDYLFDYAFDPESAFVSAVGVRSIPTTLILDRDGRLQFRDSGFGDNADVYEQNLSMRIDLLLAEDGATGE